jgi:hypothetical protein
MKTPVIIIFLASLLGCYTQKKAQHDLIKAQLSYPAVASNFARVFYPCIGIRDTIVRSDTAYQFAEISCDTTRIDTIRITTNQIIYKQAKSKIVAVPTVTVYKERLIRDTAEYALLNYRLQASEEDKQEWIAKADKRLNRSWWLIIALAVSIILNLIQLRK